jgi:hypothetical protein
MATDSEIIALVLGESYRYGTKPGEALRGAQRLMRDRDGRVSLEDVQSQEEFDRTARTTGCFKRGKVIRDPDTREIIGYELEEVSLAEACLPALA